MGETAEHTHRRARAHTHTRTRTHNDDDNTTQELHSEDRLPHEHPEEDRDTLFPKAPTFDDDLGEEEEEQNWELYYRPASLHTKQSLAEAKRDEQKTKRTSVSIGSPMHNAQRGPRRVASPRPFVSASAAEIY